MATLKLGTPVHAQNRIIDIKGKIVGKMKYENPFSVFRKKGWKYQIESDAGQRVWVYSDDCTELLNTNS